MLSSSGWRIASPGATTATLLWRQVWGSYTIHHVDPDTRLPPVSALLEASIHNILHNIRLCHTEHLSQTEVNYREIPLEFTLESVSRNIFT